MRIIIYYLRPLVLLLSLLQLTHAQQLEKDIKESRDNGLKMLKVVKDQLTKNYYDPGFHGLDLNKRFSLAEEKIKQATTGGQVVGIIAQAVLDLNDSHTMLIPPLKESVAIYGWRMLMTGDRCYVTAVMPGSDAETKGLKAGDRILALDGNEPTRDTMWKMKYYYYSLRPKSRIKVTFENSDGQTREIEVLTKLEKRHFEVVPGLIVEGGRISPELGPVLSANTIYEEFGADLIIYRFSSFNIEPDDVSKMMKKIAGHKSAILDLRSNPGGRVDTLEKVVGYFFDHEVKVGDFKQRRATKEIRVKPKTNVFTGQLVVLVDSQSSSAAEIFARLVQLEKRGIVIGDQSSGMVMESRRFDFELGTSSNPVLYGLAVTDADVVMSDGKTLEWVGVTPDKLMLPAAEDIRKHQDPVLSYAASTAGVELSPEKAGALFAPKKDKAKQ
jgi:C-terminal processing protease CtpA/Prc